MKVIGLCGGSGSGKSTIASFFRDYGVEILDADVIYHEITSYMSDCLTSLRDAFGDAIIQDNTLNRKALSAIVFEGANAHANRKRLNEITHKYVKEEMCRRIMSFEQKGIELVLLDVPLLFESDIDKICDYLICVTAPLETRIERLLKRDGVTRERAMARIASQHTDEYLIAHTHFHIINDQAPCNAKEQVKEIIKKIR